MKVKKSKRNCSIESTTFGFTKKNNVQMEGAAVAASFFRLSDEIPLLLFFRKMPLALNAMMPSDLDSRFEMVSFLSISMVLSLCCP